MRVERQPIDSDVFGCSVLTIYDFDPAVDLSDFERSYVAQYDPGYVACKVPLARIGDVHLLEAHGFRLVECQIRSTIKLRRPFQVSSNYQFEQITRSEDLGEVLAIAGTTFEQDRFTVDQQVGKGLSGRRYQAYVRKSLSDPDEAVFRLIERPTGRVVAFKTHRYLADNQVLFLLGGVQVEYKSLGLGVINSYAEMNHLIGRGVTRGITHISAANMPVFNLEIGRMGFRVEATLVVLRKIYPRPSTIGEVQSGAQRGEGSGTISKV